MEPYFAVSLLASGCGGGSLVKLGGGNLRAVIVLMFITLFGFMTLCGLTGLPRLAVEQTFSIDLHALGVKSHGIEYLAATATGIDPDELRWPLALILAWAFWFMYSWTKYSAHPPCTFSPVLTWDSWLPLDGW